MTDEENRIVVEKEVLRGPKKLSNYFIRNI